MVTNQNFIHKGIKSRLGSGMPAAIQFRIFLSSRLLSRNLKIKLHITVIVPAVMYRCQTWSLT